jgi:hypothetical protein
MPSAVRVLTLDETRLLSAPAGANNAAGPLPIIEADTLRAALFGESLDFSAAAGAGSSSREPIIRKLDLPKTGLHLPACVVRGKLNLEDLSGPGNEPFPALLFEACVFTESIELSRAHM